MSDHVIMQDWELLKPGTKKCQECAVEHDPQFPHNPDSLYYQMHFQKKNGRWPTWDDAMAHCTPEVRDQWMRHLTAARLRGEVPMNEEDLSDAVDSEDE